MLRRKWCAAIKPRPRPIATFSFADSALSNAPTTTRTTTPCTAAGTRGLADTRTAGADGDDAGAATVTADAAETTDTAATLDTAQRTATADTDTVEATGTTTTLDTADGGVITSTTTRTALLCK
jgi:hypothetical protein